MSELQTTLTQRLGRILREGLTEILAQATFEILSASPRVLEIFNAWQARNIVDQLRDRPLIRVVRDCPCPECTAARAMELN